MEDINKLIYGKNTIDKIVSIEVEENKLTIFREDEETIVLDNKFWILSNEKLHPNFSRLKGDLHYKYGIQFDKFQSFIKARSAWKKNHDIFSIFDSKESAMVHRGYTYHKNLKHNEVSVLSFDIEATTLDPEDPAATVLIISNTFRKHGIIQRKLFCYDEYENVGMMLKAWCKWVVEINPSIMVGHNIDTYDFPYLLTIADKYNISLDLGRNGNPLKLNHYESKFRKDQQQFISYKKPKIYGREVIDTFFLSIKHDVVEKKYESYALKKIIAKEGLEVKDRQHYDASLIRFNYKKSEEWAKIKQYALHDADDALALYDLMSPSYFYLAQTIPKSFQTIVESATGSQINSVMIRAYLQDGHSLPKASDSAVYEGAISAGYPGIYKNICKVDVTSLYPSIMITWEVCDHTKDPNKYFLHLVKFFTEKRIEYKKLKKDKYYDDLQNGFKIFVNSCYGFLGTRGLMFNSPAKASFITEQGRKIITRAINWSKDHNFILANVDTDAISFGKIDGSHFTEEERKNNLEQLNNCFPKRIRFEDDGYYLTFVVFAAKNYVLYDGKTIKLKGSALKDSKKEKALKEFCDSIIKAMIESQTNYTEIYTKYVNEIMNIQDIMRWCNKKTITSKVLNPKRTNEQKIYDAIQGKEYVEGDKCYLFYKGDDSLCVPEEFNGDYNVDRLLEKLYKCTHIFESVIDIDKYFLNYSLKRNKKSLLELNNNSNINSLVVNN